MKWTGTEGDFFFRPRTSTRRKTIWAGDTVFGTVLDRPDATTAYGPPAPTAWAGRPRSAAAVPRRGWKC
jgi:hypothetical protein